MARILFSKKLFILRLSLITLGSILLAFGFNMLLIPMQLLSGGISGVAMVIGYITKSNIGWLYLLLNLPVLIWGWFEVLNNATSASPVTHLRATANIAAVDGNSVNGAITPSVKHVV